MNFRMEHESDTPVNNITGNMIFMKYIKLRNIIYIITVLSFPLLLSSCVKNNVEDLIKKDTLIVTKVVPDCDTVSVTYATVKPVFDNHCVSCHNDQTSNYGIKLNTYENAKNAALTGLLKKAVNHLPGVTPMPYQQAKLNDCDVRKITIWIDTNTPQ